MSRPTLNALPPHLAALVPRSGFSGVTLLVIGDLMLDRYVEGQVHRISPEAPVPVLNVRHQRSTAGGAGNVALNLAGLRANVLLAGVLGDDPAGSGFLQVIAGHSIDVSGILFDSTRPTTTKTRIMSGGHQLVRVDEEVTSDVDVATAGALLKRTRGLLERNPSAVLLSDYAKGVLTATVLKTVLDECRARQIPVFIDPKRADYSSYSGATCLTPNLKEFQAAATLLALPVEDLAAGADLLRNRLAASMLLITQGAEGMTLLTSQVARHFPALAEDVFDVSGAGDTVVATFAAACAAGLPPLAAAELSNIAASIVVRKVGTVPIAWEELCPA